MPTPSSPRISSGPSTTTSTANSTSAASTRSKFSQSFPTIGGWNYGAVAWNRNDSPALRLGSRGYEEDGNWSTNLTRSIIPFAGMESIADYVFVPDELPGKPPVTEEESGAHMLGRTKADLVARVDSGGVARVSEAIQTLEAIIALRDAGQHSEASDRAIHAAERVGPEPLERLLRRQRETYLNALATLETASDAADNDESVTLLLQVAQLTAEAGLRLVDTANARSKKLLDSAATARASRNASRQRRSA